MSIANDVLDLPKNNYSYDLSRLLERRPKVKTQNIYFQDGGSENSKTKSNTKMMGLLGLLSKKQTSQSVEPFGLDASHKNRYANHKMFFYKMAALFTSLRAIIEV